MESSDRKLRKELSLQQLFLISIGSIIGSGWLFSALSASSVAGPAVVLSWGIAAILMLLVALNYAEVATMLPRSGAVVRYHHLSHGGYLGYIASWAFLLSTVATPAIEAEAVVTSLAPYVPGLTTGAAKVTIAGMTTNAPNSLLLTGRGIAVAILLMVFFFFVNIFGIRFLGRFNSLITWWKLIVPVLTFVLLLFAFKGSNFTTYGGWMPQGFSSVFLAISTSGIAFAYVGFRQGLDFGGETSNPQRSIPLATILSVLVAAAIYMLLQIGFTGALDWGGLGVAPGDWIGLSKSASADAPLQEALQTTGVPLLGAFSIALLFDAIVAPSGTGWIHMGSSARAFYGMSMHGDFPRFLTKIHDRTRIPWIALLASLVFGCLLFIPLPSWYLLVGYISSATALTYVMGALHLQVLRRTAPDLDRPFRLKWASVLSPLGFLAGSMIIYWSGFEILSGIVATVFLGLCVYTVFHAPGSGWMSMRIGLPLGGAFLIVWVTTQLFGPIFSDSLSFPVFFALISAEVLGFSALVWWFSDEDGRHAVNAAWWLFFMVLGTYLLSYYGAYGYYGTYAYHAGTPPIPFPYDNLIALAIGLVSYYWGVESGFITDEIRAIVKSGTGLVREIEEEILTTETAYESQLRERVSR